MDIIFNYGQQVWGSVEIAKQVTITSSNNTFAFDIDGTTHTITIPNGTYSTSRERHTSALVTAIASGASSVPVEFKLGGMHYDDKYNVLIIEHTDKENEHVLDNFTGSANDTIFGSVKFNLAPRD